MKSFQNMEEAVPDGEGGPSLIPFKAVTESDGGRLREYYRSCRFELCEYSVGTKLMWKTEFHPAWAEIAGCLVVRNEIDGEIVFDYPVPGEGGDENAALTAIELDCMKRGLPLVISVVPECRAPLLMKRYPYVRVSSNRTWQDYIYSQESLRLFAGRRYSGQRNHIRNFRARWPNARFRRLDSGDTALIQRFWEDYEAEFLKTDNAKARNELTLAKRMVKMADREWFAAGGMFDGERLIALSLAEKCGDTLIIHVEKALYSYTGVYPALVQSFAAEFGEDCLWINREDDAADPGLRRSKLQYGPARLAPKYRFEPETAPLDHLRASPELKTERLALSARTPARRAAGNGPLWDKASAPDGSSEKSGLERGRTVCFAVQLNGEDIGEVLLHHFDWRGSAELNCRIAEKWSGHGYGTEAFSAVANWGLYKLHLSRVAAKCPRESGRSCRMLASCMRRVGEDESYLYFEKVV